MAIDPSIALGVQGGSPLAQGIQGFLGGMEQGRQVRRQQAQDQLAQEQAARQAELQGLQIESARGQLEEQTQGRQLRSQIQGAHEIMTSANPAEAAAAFIQSNPNDPLAAILQNTPPEQIPNVLAAQMSNLRDSLSIMQTGAPVQAPVDEWETVEVDGSVIQVNKRTGERRDIMEGRPGVSPVKVEDEEGNVFWGTRNDETGEIISISEHRAPATGTTFNFNDGEVSDREQVIVEGNREARSHLAEADRLERLFMDVRAADWASGMSASVSEWVKGATGTQDFVTALRQDVEALRLQEALQYLPPGSSSDTEMRSVLAIVPDSNSSQDEIMRFVAAASMAKRMEGIARRAEVMWQGTPELRQEYSGSEGLERYISEQIREAELRGDMVIDEEATAAFLAPIVGANAAPVLEDGNLVVFNDANGYPVFQFSNDGQDVFVYANGEQYGG